MTPSTSTSSLQSILSENYLYIGFRNKSKPEFIAHLQEMRARVPDLTWRVEEMLVDGNRVAVRSLLSGSPVGTFLGVNDLDGSKSFLIWAVDIHSVEDGKIECTHHVEDWISAVAQLQ